MICRIRLALVLIILVSWNYKTMALLLLSIFTFFFSADAATASTETDVREREMSPNSAGSFSPISPTPAAVSRNSSCYSLIPYLEMTLSPPPVNTDIYEKGYLYVTGQSINITCEASNKSASGNSTIFIHSCNGTKPSSVATYGTATLTMTNSSEGQYWLACWQVNSVCSQNPQVDQFEADPIDCLFCKFCNLTTVYFGFAPPEPSLSRCESKNGLELECTWTVGSGSFQTNWNVSYLPPNRINDSKICERKWYMCGNTSVREGSNTSLTCIVNQYCVVPFSTFSFQLNGRNGFGETMKRFTVTADTSIVKLSGVEFLNVASDAPNKLTLRWAFSNFTSALENLKSQLECRIKMSSDWKMEVKYFNMTKSNCTREVTLHDLTPYKMYTFQIQIKLLDSFYWSDPRETNITTPEDIPSAAPEVTSGGHVLWQCGQEQCLTMYWKPPPPEHRNGILTAFNLTMTTESSQLLRPIQISNTTNGSAVSMSIRYVPLTYNSTQRVCVSASTSAGFSRQSGCIVLPSGSKPSAPNAPKSVNVEYIYNEVGNNATYVITWSTYNTTAGYVTVFWCRGPQYGDSDVTHVRCQTDMNWIHLPSNMSLYELSLNNTPKQEGLVWFFGVSTVSQNLSTGITWNRCIYDRNGEPPPPSLIASDVKEKQFTVAWGFNLCDVNFLRTRPFMYQIFYKQYRPDTGEKQCTGGHQLNLIPDWEVKDVTLNDLEPSAMYYVCMRIVTRTNRSEVSEPLLVRLQQPDEEEHTGTMEDIYIFFAASGGFVVMAFGIIFIIYCRHKITAKMTKFPIDSTWIPKWKGKNPHYRTFLPNPGKDRIHHNSHLRTPNFKETVVQESRVSENTNAFLPEDPGKDNPIRDSSLLISSSGVTTTDSAKVGDPRQLTSQVSKRLEFAFQRRNTCNASNEKGCVTEYTDGKSSDTYIIDGKRKSSNSCNQNGCLQIIANQAGLNPNKNYQLGYMLMIASEVEKSSSSFNNIEYVRPSTDDKGEHSETSIQTGCAPTNQDALPTNKTDEQPRGSLNVCLEVDRNTYSMFTDQCGPTVNMALIGETPKCDTQEHIINTIVRTDAVKTHSPAVKVALDAAQELEGEPEDRLPGAKKDPDDKSFGDRRSPDCDIMKVTDIKEQRFGLSTLNKSYLHVNGLSQTCETQHAAV